MIGESAEARDMLGPEPFGRVILTPEHTVGVYIAKQGRNGPPTNDAEAAALLSSMNAYTGRYRIEGDEVVTAVDGAWNEIFKAREQVRYFSLDGDKLTLRTPEQPSATLPGKRASPRSYGSGRDQTSYFAFALLGRAAALPSPASLTVSTAQEDTFRSADMY